MALYWIVHQVGREKRVFIQQAAAPLTARLKAAIAGHTGAYVEHHALDEATAAKVPQRAIGRVLSQAEAQALLKRLARIAPKSGDRFSDRAMRKRTRRKSS